MITLRRSPWLLVALHLPFVAAGPAIALPRHDVPPSQQVPSRCTAATTASVRSAEPKPTSTWLSTTSLWIVAPPAASSSAIVRAWSQHRSTRSVTPLRPSSRARRGS